jgi:DNA-binding MarR family transcriptional regulator
VKVIGGHWNRWRKNRGCHAIAGFAILACSERKLYRRQMAKLPPARMTPKAAFGFLPDLLGYHLRRAQSAVFQDFAVSMSGADITPGQFGVLALIEANAGLSQTRLAQILGIDRSTLVAVIDKLERQGLVERAARPNDRRSHVLKLSRGGLARFRSLERRVRQHEARIARQLSARERATLIALLQRIG